MQDSSGEEYTLEERMQDSSGEEYTVNNANWKLFSFVNFYLSGIQKGIQTAHVIAEMSRLGTNFEFAKWAADYKTIIVCDGGDSENLSMIYSVFYNSGFDFGAFYESGLNNTLTAVAIVLPDWIYNSDLYNVVNNISTREKELRKFMSLRKLAAN